MIVNNLEIALTSEKEEEEEEQEGKRGEMVGEGRWKRGTVGRERRRVVGTGCKFYHLLQVYNILTNDGMIPRPIYIQLSD